MPLVRRERHRGEPGDPGPLDRAAGALGGRQVGRVGSPAETLLCPGQWEPQSEYQLQMPQWSVREEGRGVASWPGVGGWWVGRAHGELTGSVPFLVPGFCGWSWAEGDPQREPMGWAGGGLPGTAIPQGLSVCPVLESGALNAASGWAVALSVGLYPYRCLSLVEVFVAE